MLSVIEDPDCPPDLAVGVYLDQMALLLHGFASRPVTCQEFEQVVGGVAHPYSVVSVENADQGVVRFRIYVPRQLLRGKRAEKAVARVRNVVEQWRPLNAIFEYELERIP